MAISAKAVKRLKDAFVDQTVIIYLKGMNVIVANEEQQEMNIAAMIESYIIDIDENYLYTGTPDGNITRIISHDTAQMVELQLNGDMMEMPSFDEDVH